MKTAIIIGASTGIGRETALALSGTFDQIAITSYRHSEELEELRLVLEERGTRCFSMCGDAGDFQFMETFIKRVYQVFGGRIDLLINNAGISYVGLLTDMSAEEFDRLMKTNVYSVYNSCRLVVPAMVSAKCGCIINVSSVWGVTGASCEVAYSASKGAINSFTKALGKELAPSGISVNAIAFGAIDTPMNDHLTNEEKQELAYEIPAGRMASPKEAAQFILRISECNPYLNGQVITYDGAWI